MSKMWSAGASSDCVLCLTYIVSSAALNSTPTNQVLCLVEEMLDADNINSLILRGKNANKQR